MLLQGVVHYTIRPKDKLYIIKSSAQKNLFTDFFFSFSFFLKSFNPEFFLGFFLLNRFNFGIIQNIVRVSEKS